MHRARALRLSHRPDRQLASLSVLARVRGGYSAALGKPCESCARQGARELQTLAISERGRVRKRGEGERGDGESSMAVEDAFAAAAAQPARRRRWPLYTWFNDHRPALVQPRGTRSGEARRYEMEEQGWRGTKPGAAVVGQGGYE